MQEVLHFIDSSLTAKKEAVGIYTRIYKNVKNSISVKKKNFEKNRDKCYFIIVA